MGRPALLALLSAAMMLPGTSRPSTAATRAKAELLAELVTLTKEFVRAVEDAICLLQARLNLFNLPIRLFAQPPGLLDKFTATRDDLRRLTQFGSIRQPLVVTFIGHRSPTHPSADSMSGPFG